jgi:hypothetical protein
VNRQQQAKGAANTRLAIDFDAATVALNNVIRQRKPKPGPFARRLGGKKRPPT